MRVFLLIALSVFVADTALAQVCEGDVTLTSQAEVEGFACTEVQGALTIQGADVTDLTPLQDLTRVSELTVVETQVTSLAGLESLQTLSGGLDVRNNASLTVLDGLTGLTSVSGSLSFIENPALERFGRVGAPDATLAFDDLNVLRNPELVSLDGLESVSMLKALYIDENARLPSLRGLDGLTRTTKFLIYRNPALVSLEGVESLIRSGNIEIEDNDALQTLDGFSALVEADGHVTVRQNAALTQCACGFSRLIEDGTFAYAWTVTISDNAPGGTCTSPEAVLADSCAATADEDRPGDRLTVAIHPNPTSSGACTAYTLPMAGDARVTVHDALGREVAVLADGPHPAGEHTAPLGPLAPGVYLVRVVTGTGARTAAVTVAR